MPTPNVLPIKSTALCAHCQTHRIMRGSEVYTWVLQDGAATVDLHAQCVGPYLLAEPDVQDIRKTLGDPAQTDIEDEEEDDDA